MKDIKETVLITGASHGIGRGLALYYADQGATVILVDIDEDQGREVIDQIHEKGGRAHFYPCDVRKPEQIEELFQNTEKEIGPLTILINNAGVSRFKALFDLDTAEWDDVINTNLRSTFLCSQQAAKCWKKYNLQGRIVNIASTRAFMSEPDAEAYAASKGGIVTLTHALAASLSSYNIRVNSISPGWIHTGAIDELRKIDHEQHLSNRVGTVEDVAKACAYLADADTHFVNGENLVLDGGMTRKMVYEH